MKPNKRGKAKKGRYFVAGSLKNQFAENRTKLYYKKQVTLHPKIKLDEGLTCKTEQKLNTVKQVLFKW
jgi:hypothetical protein